MTNTGRKPLAFVGDGHINDAPLAGRAADVGIAMGGRRLDAG